MEQLASAASDGDISTIGLLIECGVDVNEGDYD